MGSTQDGPLTTNATCANSEDKGKDGSANARAPAIDEVRINPAPLLLGERTLLSADERAELIPGKPVAEAVTHLRYRVAKP